jgi:hypothetical protein
MAYDPDKKVYYIWEVKRKGGGPGDDVAGAEASGPADLDWYMQNFRTEHPGATIRRGPEIWTRLPQEDPLDRANSTLITTSSRYDDPTRKPKFDGVIVYWTHKRQPEDEEHRSWNLGTEEAAASPAASPPVPTTSPKATQAPAPPGLGQVDIPGIPHIDLPFWLEPIVAEPIPIA